MMVWQCIAGSWREVLLSTYCTFWIILPLSIFGPAEWDVHFRRGVVNPNPQVCRWFGSCIFLAPPVYILIFLSTGLVAYLFVSREIPRHEQGDASRWRFAGFPRNDIWNERHQTLLAIPCPLKWSHNNHNVGPTRPLNTWSPTPRLSKIPQPWQVSYQLMAAAKYLWPSLQWSTGRSNGKSLGRYERCILERLKKNEFEKRRTARAELQFKVAQFNSEPVLVGWYDAVWYCRQFVQKLYSRTEASKSVHFVNRSLCSVHALRRPPSWRLPLVSMRFVVDICRHCMALHGLVSLSHESIDFILFLLEGL